MAPITKTVTINAEEPFVVMSMREYESMKETLEVLTDPEMMKQIRETEKARKEGKKPVEFEELRLK